MNNLIVNIIMYLIVIPGLWKMFEKAGIEGWKAMIPVYRWYLIVMILAKIDIIYFILLIILFVINVLMVIFLWFDLLLVFSTLVMFFIAILDIVIKLKINKDVAKNFGVSSPFIFSFGLTFLSIIFYSILGFGNYDFINEDVVEIIE